MARILIVDDEPVICWTLSEAFREEGHDCATAASAEDAIAAAAKGRFDLVLLDVRLPGQDGISAIGELKSILGDVPILIMTAFGDLETAVRAVEKGSFEYLIKPFDLNFALNAVQQALCSATAGKAETSKNRAADPYRIVGSSREMQAIYHRIALAARSEAPVLITGESGTGKELVARAIHTHGTRGSGPFLAANMAAFNSGLMEKELFGHLKGAFTGADMEAPGLFRQAQGGTLFLDEIGELPVEMQVKLLRVLENREVIPVGASRPTRIDVRIVAATNRPLEESVSEGKIREDFYYRLNVFRIQLPPLRDRLDDFEELARHFLKDHRPGISDAALKSLIDRSWPGNVRQLKNAVEHATILARNQTIQPEHLPAETRMTATDSAGKDLDRLFASWLADEMQSGEANEIYEKFLARFEPLLIKQVLSAFRDQKQPAARALGLHRATLRQMMRKHGLVDE
jgi:DNA-binding NtrC family response regulator